jgi:hypothetical protein
MWSVQQILHLIVSFTSTFCGTWYFQVQRYDRIQKDEFTLFWHVRCNFTTRKAIFYTLNGFPFPQLCDVFFVLIYCSLYLCYWRFRDEKREVSVLTLLYLTKSLLSYALLFNQLFYNLNFFTEYMLFLTLSTTKFSPRKLTVGMVGLV